MLLNRCSERPTVSTAPEAPAPCARRGGGSWGARGRRTRRHDLLRRGRGELETWIHTRRRILVRFGGRLGREVRLSLEVGLEVGLVGLALFDFTQHVRLAFGRVRRAFFGRAAGILGGGSLFRVGGSVRFPQSRFPGLRGRFLFVGALASSEVRLEIVRTDQIFDMEERGALQPDIDEGRLHPGEHPSDFSSDDVAKCAARAGAL